MSNELQITASLSRGLDILRAFDSDEEWLGNQELAELTRLPKSTVTRTTNTLLTSGFLEANPALQKFRLGPAVLRLAERVTHLSNLRSIFRPVLQSLATETGVSVGIAHVDQSDMVYFEYCRSTGPVSLSLSVGSRVPILNTAGGSAILAISNALEREHLAAVVAASGGSRAAATLKEQLKRAEREFKADGVCRSYGTYHPEVNAIAAPYRAPVTGLACAITAAGPPYSVSADHLDKRVAPRLHEALRIVNAAFGR